MSQANKLQSIESLTVQNATSALDQGLAAIKAGTTVFDLASVKLADSSAVAVLLAWKRAARKSGTALSYVNVPAGLQSLAALYGVDSFLVESPANLHHH
ncbi:lipid asymmetry maintenance protein MlaB [Massilia sp. CF038]|uniref:STAS domain-containing protein n=1 Tax=Massilia sp. CF038 TaxID=1881045 RepID=UPI00091DCA6D|nr:STAS domain-containing protein [Massilia sp. CF038]SHH65705.1 phospholipid transport system transporter-binding protein [Massilia sp. CF038]